MASGVDPRAARKTNCPDALRRPPELGRNSCCGLRENRRHKCRAKNKWAKNIKNLPRLFKRASRAGLDAVWGFSEQWVYVISVFLPLPVSKENAEVAMESYSF
jgi:hypothetical protein